MKNSEDFFLEDKYSNDKNYKENAKECLWTLVKHPKQVSLDKEIV